jgi:tetratricopeptide (TPR) repeat protein
VKPRHWFLIGATVAGVAFCTLAVIFVVGHSNPAIQDDPMLFTTGGHPSRIEVEGSSIRVAFEWDRFSLLIPNKDPELKSLLEAAHDTGEAVSFRTQLAGTHFDADSGLPVFWVQSVHYLDKTFGPYEVQVPWSWRVLIYEQAALLKGVAYHHEREYNAALTQFDAGLRTDKLRPAERGLAMALRAEVYQYRSYAEPTKLGKDYLLARSNEDFAQAVKYRRDDYSLLTSRAAVLIELGAYEEALALLEQTLKSSRAMHFRAGIMAADVLRRRDRYPEAMRILDEVGARDADMLGMMYYYHRGWTLLLLKREPEAAAAFSEGLNSQRGWPWVYIGRACAQRVMGDADAALADLRTAVEAMDRSAERDVEPVKSLRPELRNNIAALGRERTAMDANLTICEHFQPNFDRPLRERSKLLDSMRPVS